MWGIIISALVQIAVALIKMWIENRSDRDEAIAEVGRLADAAVKSGDSRPLKDFIQKLRDERRAKRAEK